MKIIKNLIIGAGPAGLATAGRMTKAGLKYTLLEKSQHVGNAWRNHYDRLHLHTVKQWSHLPHLPFPEEYPTYVSRQQLVDYMEDYARHFQIEMEGGTEIVRIIKSKDNLYWEAHSVKGKVYPAYNIIVATGVNRVTHIPTWKDQDVFSGEIIHSRAYKNPQPFLGKKVLVVGMGNTGAELALDLSEHDVDISVCVRGEISVVPRDLNGRPVQETAKLLEKLPFGFGDWLGSQIRKIYFGNLEPYGLKVSKIHPVVLLRTTGKTPLVDIGTIAAIKSGKIKVLGEMDRFISNGVHFKKEGPREFDAVILATGYRSKIEEFVQHGSAVLDQYGFPKGPIGKEFHQGLFFVGFDNYKTGGILGTIYNDSQTVVEHIHSLKIKRKNNRHAV